MFILKRQGGITAKELAKLCNARISKNPDKIPYNDFIINYGQKTERTNLNKNINFNKVSVHSFLDENGILVPKMFNKNDNISDNIFPLLARQNYHSKGRDIIYIKNKNELNKLNNSREDYDYLVQYINKHSEYRVHVLKGYQTIVNIKVNGEDDRNEIVRCRDNGWKQIEYRGEFREKLIEIGEKVVDLLEYDFAAIDIIRDKNNKFYVLEVNSAPGLEERKLKIYANFFLKKEEEFNKSKERINVTETPKLKVNKVIPKRYYIKESSQGKYGYYGT